MEMKVKAISFHYRLFHDKNNYYNLVHNSCSLGSKDILLHSSPKEMKKLYLSILPGASGSLTLTYLHRNLPVFVKWSEVYSTGIKNGLQSKSILLFAMESKSIYPPGRTSKTALHSKLNCMYSNVITFLYLICRSLNGFIYAVNIVQIATCS